MGVAGILLAAGGGSRLGQPKALVEFGGQTLAERGVTMLREGGAAPVLVVAGAVRVAVRGAWTVRNLDWRDGMGSSLRAGLHAFDMPNGPGDPQPGHDPDRAGEGLPVSRLAGVWAAEVAGAGVDAAVIALADQPLVGPQAVRRLIAAYDAGSPVVAAAYDGKPRNPVLIAREYWPQVLELAVGDTGARPFLRAHSELVTLVECGDIASALDIDTPADLAQLRSQLGGQRLAADGGSA